VSKTSSIRPVVPIQYRFVTDRQTDRRTHDDSKYRVSIASRGKNYEYVGHFQQVSKVTSPHSFKFDFRRNLHKIAPSSGGGDLNRRLRPGSLVPRESASGISIGSAVLHSSSVCPTHRLMHADHATCDKCSTGLHLCTAYGRRDGTVGCIRTKHLCAEIRLFYRFNDR